MSHARQTITLPFTPREWQRPLQQQAKRPSEGKMAAGELPVVAELADQLDVSSCVRTTFAERHNVIYVEFAPNGFQTVGACMLLKHEKPGYISRSVTLGFSSFGSSGRLVLAALVGVLRKPFPVAFVRSFLVSGIAFFGLLEDALRVSGLIRCFSAAKSFWRERPIPCCVLALAGDTATS